MDCPNVNADMKTDVSDTALNATDLITNCEKSGTATVAPVTDHGKDKNLSVAEAATGAAASESGIKNQTVKKQNPKLKKAMQLLQ